MIGRTCEWSSMKLMISTLRSGGLHSEPGVAAADEPFGDVEIAVVVHCDRMGRVEPVGICEMRRLDVPVVA